MATLGIENKPLGFIAIVGVLDRHIAVILVPRVEGEGLVLGIVWRSVVRAVECDIRRLWFVATEVGQSDTRLMRRRRKGEVAIIARSNGA